MRRIRSIVICTSTVLALLTVIPHRAGAGGSTFSFNRRWFAPGQTAVGTTQFSDGIEGQGLVAEGPYFAYLLRGDRFIDPPHVPKDAFALGRVRMLAVDASVGIWEASIQFVIPDVRPGRYTVSLCNDPCRDAYVGDLMGAWISIAASAEQAKLKNLEAGIEERVTQQLWETISSLQEQLDALRERPPSTTVATELRLTATEDQIERLNAQVRDLQERADQGLMAWLWVAGWVVAAGIAILWRRTTIRQGRSVAIARSSEAPPSDEVVWNEVSPPIYDEEMWPPDRGRSPGELVSR